MILRRLVLVTFMAILLGGSIAADEIDRALAESQQYIKAKQFAEALDLLDSALELADSLPAEVQTQARSAIHFYTAVAHSGLGNDGEALDHLDELFRLSPQIRSVDPEKYDAHFVELFNTARASSVESGGFGQYYPAFSPTEPPVQQDPSASWQGNPAIQTLGSRAEKKAWRTVASAGRDAFLAKFWQDRDRTPATETNEFREQFERRVGYADAVFGIGSERGSLTDRGRVFLLLGEPAHVRRRAIQRNDNIQSFNRGSVGIVGGTIEYWFYRRDQLPVEFSRATIVYRFVSHQGIGNYVLQRDGMAMNLLALAAEKPQE